MILVRAYLCVVQLFAAGRSIEGHPNAVDYLARMHHKRCFQSLAGTDIIIPSE
jgi:hypothetical protein